MTKEDFARLGLKSRDASPTITGAPTAQVGVETALKGRHELGIKLFYTTGRPDDPANKSYRIWYKAVAPGETPPATPDELPLSISTRRKNDILEFKYEDNGKTAHIAVQIENGKKKGPWGPMTSAVIP